MWQAVRRELARLEWDAAPPLTQDLLSDWTHIVQRLVEIRRGLGPVSVHDPLAMLATATTGAARTPGSTPSVAPSLHDVSAALADVARVMEGEPDLDRGRELATLNHVAYVLAHWVRIRTTDDRAKAWLLAGERALDGAIHAPADCSGIGVGLAAWQDALAAVQPVQHAAIVRRSVALGHLAILRNAHALVEEARQRGALPAPYSDALLGNIRDLARAHQTTLSRIDGGRLGSSRVDQAVMLKVGTAVRQLTGHPDSAEPVRVRLDALLRSSVGQAVLVANLTNEPSGKRTAGSISRLSLEYLANPGMLRPESPPMSTPPVAPAERPTAPVHESQHPATATLGETSIKPGTVLDGETILALCRARDLGVAAAAGDVADPPEILRGTDPSRWPQMVVEGRRAVNDLVASVIPMAYAQTRRTFNAADLRGQMFVELMCAAARFDPQRGGPDRWPMYAWMTMRHVGLRGVDGSGVVRRHSSHPRPTIGPIGGWEPVSSAPDPDTAIDERGSIGAIKQALEKLPSTLRDPLLESMRGCPVSVIAEEFGFSERTAHRRIKEARDLVREALAPREGNGAWVPFETVTDPVLDRSQRLFEQTFAPSLGPPRRGGPDR